jgi:O-antigen ligase
MWHLPYGLPQQQDKCHIAFRRKILKNTKRNRSESNLDETNINVARQDRWAGLPFLVFMFSAGLPLTYQLSVARPMTVADTAEITMATNASQNTGNSLLFVIFICSLYIFSGLKVLRRPNTFVSLLYRQWPILFLTLYIAASTLWSYAPEKVMINSVHCIGTTFIAISAALRYRQTPWLFPKHVGYVVGVNMALQLIAVAIMPAYAIDWQGRWQGLAPHPNTLGAMSFVVLWSNATIVMFTNDDKYRLHLLFSFLALVAMFGANSMTTMACSLFALSVLFSFLKMRAMNTRQRLSFTIMGLCLILPLMTALLIKIVNVEAILNAFGRDSNLTGRTSLWQDAVKAISEHLFLGWSFDDHAHLVKVSNMAFPNFHNGILDLAVNGGVVAVMLFLLILITAASDFFKHSRIGASIAPFSSTFILTYLAYSFTEANLVAPRSQMWVMFLALIFLGACKNWPKTLISHFAPAPAPHTESRASAMTDLNSAIAK